MLGRVIYLYIVMKVAIITGAAQGIGRRTAEVLAAAGYPTDAVDALRAAGVIR